MAYAPVFGDGAHLKLPAPNAAVFSSAADDEDPDPFRRTPSQIEYRDAKYSSALPDDVLVLISDYCTIKKAAAYALD